MCTKTAFQREEVQVCTKSQLNHIESRVEKENLEPAVHIFYTDCETVTEGITGWWALEIGR